MKVISSFMKADLINSFRDPMLGFILIIPLASAAVLRFAVPLLAQHLSAYIDLEPFYPLISCLFVLIGPAIAGMTSGFLLLDERDEEILRYFAVTPISRERLLVIRFFYMMVLSLIIDFSVIPLLALVPVDLSKLLPAVLLASLEAPLFAVFLAAFAQNKVQGLAFSKALGIFFLAPFAYFFLEAPLKYFAGILPSYWVASVFLGFNESLSSHIASLVIGFAYHIVLIGLLWRRFKKKLF